MLCVAVYECGFVVGDVRGMSHTRGPVVHQVQLQLCRIGVNKQGWAVRHDTMAWLLISHYMLKL